MATDLAAPQRSLDFRRFDATILVLFVAIVVVVMTFAQLSPSMLTSHNAIDILRQMSFVAIASLGTTFVIISGRIDLSIGSTITLASTMMALLVSRHGLPGPLGVLLPLVIGTAVGVLNGLLVTKARVTSVIATLGTLIAIDGAAKLIVGGETIAGLPRAVTYLGRESIGPIPVAVLLTIVVWVASVYVLRRTRFGRYCYHIGTNERAAWINGVPVDRYVIGYFAVGGLFSGLSALVLTGRLLSANVDIGSGRELQAIAVVVIGGGSLFGGKGTATGTVLAAALLVVITNGLRQINVNAFWQIGVTGALIILAVGIDALRQKRVS